jgi:hypothetical protein
MGKFIKAIKKYFTKRIDWEQRTYDVAAQLYVRQLTLSEQECVDAAKKLIDTYRKQSEL